MYLQAAEKTCQSLACESESKILGMFDVDKSPTWCQETVGRRAANAPLLAVALK